MQKWKNYTICIEEETELMWPSTWVATRLKNIIELLSGRDLSPNQYTDIPNGIPYITGASNFLCGEIKTDRFTPVPQVIVYKGDLLITCKGTVGELAYCPYEQAHIARQIMAIRNSFGLNLEYICNCVRFYVEKIKNAAKGLIPGISREDMLNLIIPLPPLNEQVKINSQINVLMKSIKSIDEKSQSLTTDIGNLKSKILDLAIRGKLVSQNTDDEPASMLLERIREEKEELIKQGKIKRDKKESIIFKGEDNSYYEKYGEELPQGWVVTNLETLLSYEQPTEYIVESTDYNDAYPTPVLTAGKSFILGYTNETSGIFKRIPTIIFDDFTTESKYVDFEFKVKSSAMKILSPNTDLVLSKFAYYLMQSVEVDHDNHQRYWISVFSKQVVALPPLAEQQRIVDMIEHLYSLLDNAML